MENRPSTESDVQTYRRIRKAIGILGTGLPVTLLVLSLFPFFRTSIQPSISDYYYSNFRELFTGVLCAVGLFLIRYRGNYNPVIWKDDSRLTNIAGYMAFGVALFPTNPAECSLKVFTLVPYCNGFLGIIHYAFAATFFAALALISINAFTIGQKENKDIPLSLINENRIYKACGYLIAIFILMVPLFAILKVHYSTFLFESLALFSFGISWSIKGRVLGDRGTIGRKLYREENG